MSAPLQALRIAGYAPRELRLCTFWPWACPGSESPSKGFLAAAALAYAGLDHAGVGGQPAGQGAGVDVGAILAKTAHRCGGRCAGCLMGEAFT